MGRKVKFSGRVEVSETKVDGGDVRRERTKRTNLKITQFKF